MKRRIALATALLLLFVSIQGLAGTVAAPDSPVTVEGKAKPDKWKWLPGTTWIVPPDGLPALVFDTADQSITPVSDQTVYQITEYRDGYFWGQSGTKLGSGSVVCSTLVGSVTPPGELLLLFTRVGNDQTTTLQQGFGSMAKQHGEWTMLNQTGSTSFTHWAYMVQSKPGDASWVSLPGAKVSVKEFMAPCTSGS